MIGRSSVVSLLVFLMLAACQQQQEGTSAPSQSAGVQQGDPGSWVGVTVETQHLDFEIPAAWQLEKPSSRMRIAQATIPGDAGPAELAVFYFGPGQGGGVDANIDRWIQQMEASPNTAPTREAFQVGDLTVTWVDVGGTLKAGSMGMGPSSPQPNYRLLGAVVEGPQGPWFFKATGPDQTLSEARQTFVAMLRTARPKAD